MSIRLQSIDFVRGIAILAMIQSHIWGIFIASKNYANNIFYKWLIFPLGGFAAPLFIVISGLSSNLALKAVCEEKKLDQNSIKGLFIKRGLLLFILSSIINLVAGAVLQLDNIHWLNWSVFQLIGICYLIIPFFGGWKITGKVLFSAAILLLAASESRLSIIPTILFTGFTPFFPWASLFFFGYLVGDLYTSQHYWIQNRRYLLLLISGLTILLMIKPVLELYQIPFNNWDKTLGMNLSSFSVYMGCFLCLIAVVGYLLDYRRLNPWIVGVVSGLGQHAMTIYYIQLFGIIGVGMGMRKLFGESAVLDPIWFLPVLGFTILGLHFGVNVFWRKMNYKFSLEWFLRGLSVKKWLVGPKLQPFNRYSK